MKMQVFQSGFRDNSAEEGNFQGIGGELEQGLFVRPTVGHQGLHYGQCPGRKRHFPWATVFGFAQECIALLQIDITFLDKTSSQFAALSPLATRLARLKYLCPLGAFLEQNSTHVSSKYPGAPGYLSCFKWVNLRLESPIRNPKGDQADQFENPTSGFCVWFCRLFGVVCGHHGRVSFQPSHSNWKSRPQHPGF